MMTFAVALLLGGATIALVGWLFKRRSKRNLFETEAPTKADSPIAKAKKGRS